MSATLEAASHRRTVWLLAWPLILSNLTVPLLGLVDTAVMGHLPDTRYLGAVTLGATLFSFLYWGFGFLRMGTTGLAAQRAGADDANGQRLVLAQALGLGAVIGIGLLALQVPLIRVGLWLLDGSAEVSHLAEVYARIRMWSAPAVLANYALLGWFLGLGNSRYILLLMLTNNLVNIVLDLVFVLGLGMTVGGVALASVIADYSALALGLWLARGVMQRIGGTLPGAELLRIGAYRQLVAVNSALFVRTLCLLFAMAFFTSQSARQGDLLLAANAVLLQFVVLASYGLDGFAHATESLVGRAIGRKDPALFRSQVRAATEWSILLTLCLSLSYWVGGQALIAGLTGIDAVRTTAAIYLPWVIVMPLVAMWSYLLDGIFIGATRTRAMRDTMLAAVLFAYLPAWYVTTGLGNHGLWLALTLFLLARSALLGGVFLREWRQRRWFAQETPADGALSSRSRESRQPSSRDSTESTHPAPARSDRQPVPVAKSRSAHLRSAADARHDRPDSGR